MLFSAGQIGNALRQERVIDHITTGIFELNNLANDYLLSPGERALSQWRQRYDSLSILIRSEEFRASGDQLLVAEVQANHERSQTIFERLRRLRENDRDGEAKANPKAAGLEQRLTAHFLETLQIMICDIERLMTASHRRFDIVSRNAAITLALLLLATAAIITLGSLLISRSIIKPIARLREGTEMVGAGNLHYRIGAAGTDEIGTLSRAFDRMTENLLTVTVSRDTPAEEMKQRERAEARIKESEKLYRGAIEASGAVPYYKDYRTNIFEFIGPNIETLTGYSQEEFAYEVWRSIAREVVLQGQSRAMTFEEADRKVRKGGIDTWQADYRIRTRAGEERWLFNASVRVRDTGHGMTEETLEHIFDPFFTTKEVGKGTGLGLSTAYGIIKQSEGYIFAQSTPGLDTTFTIYLQSVAGGAEEHDGAQPLQEASLKRADKRGPEVIFLVEDEEPLRKLACKILEKSGYTVMSAADGKKALEMARASRGTRVDLLVTDVIMPEMSGRDISTELRKIYPELNVLYMSGYTDDVIAPHGVLDEGVFFIQKPFSPAEFEHRIREVLDGK